MVQLADAASAFDRVVEDLGTAFAAAPGIILTEEDLRCQLYSGLVSTPELSAIAPTADPTIRGSAVHCNLSWFGDERGGKSGTRARARRQGTLELFPDITILDPRNFSITRALEVGVPFPTKGAHFIGSALIAELKFLRSPGRPSWEALEKDRKKMEDIIDRHKRTGIPVEGRLVVFARYSRWAEEIRQRFPNVEPVLKTMVRTANL